MKIEFYLENELLNMLKTRPVTQIYVSNLIERVGVCKGTFYKYYCDKYDLLQKCFYNNFYREIIEKSDSTKEFLKGCLTAFRASPKVVLHAMDSDEPNSLSSYNNKLVFGYVERDRVKLGKPVEGDFYTNIINFFSQNVTQIFISWLAGGCVNSNDEVMDFIAGMVPRALEAS